MIHHQPFPFNAPWQTVSIVSIDVETTGLDHNAGGVVQIGLARFEDGKCVGTMSSLIYPGCQIPADATEIHGVRQDDVIDAPSLHHWLTLPDVMRFYDGCQPLSHNAPFDRRWMPLGIFDSEWPWLDSLTVSRACMADGKGRHKLESLCKRLKIELQAHNAESDARACGEAFMKVVPMAAVRRGISTLGELLAWTMREQAEDWFRFQTWLSKQPKEVE